MKKRIGITGQIGFIGTHLTNFLNTKPTEFEIIPFDDNFWLNDDKLKHFASQCDTIIHLAAMNRGNPEELYKTNIGLVKRLCTILEEINHKPHIVFSSSTQEERNNIYGNSKKEGRLLFEQWAEKNNAQFTGLIIPNVFGPFGVPFYNSVISTFCHQITHNLSPKIEIDASLKIIYINDLVDVFYRTITGHFKKKCVLVEHIAEKKVSEILKILYNFKSLYLENGIIPDLKSYFDICLFNTFRTYIDHNHYPFYLKKHSDNRGYLSEIIKTNIGGQTFFSVSKPGIIRGNHYHRRKIERFIVIKGKAIIKLRRIGTENIIEYRVSGDKPSFIDIPIHHTHNIENIGNEELYTLFWTNEIYNPNDPDTYFEEV